MPGQSVVFARRAAKLEQKAQAAMRRKAKIAS
jgi:hypothetical protein